MIMWMTISEIAMVPEIAINVLPKGDIRDSPLSARDDIKAVPVKSKMRPAAKKPTCFHCRFFDLYSEMTPKL